jgi:hypothetical protein
VLEALDAENTGTSFEAFAAKSPRKVEDNGGQGEGEEGGGRSGEKGEANEEEPTSQLRNMRPATEVITPFVEMGKFASQYDPDAKFERAQPAVPQVSEV